MRNRQGSRVRREEKSGAERGERSAEERRGGMMRGERDGGEGCRVKKDRIG